MHRTERFALETHEGPYESWGTSSRLVVDGRLTELRLPGFQLLQQFEIPDGFIVITDYDCPFEEITNFVLLSKRLRKLSCRWLGAPYYSSALDRLEWIDERGFTAFMCDGSIWRLSVRSWGIPYLRPRLRMQRMWRAEAEANAREAAVQAREPATPP
jgi:hypothetical protein